MVIFAEDIYKVEIRNVCLDIFGGQMWNKEKVYRPALDLLGQ